MSLDPRKTANRRRSSGAQLVCAWLHLTPRECYTLARASSDAALEMAVGYGLDRPVARELSEAFGVPLPVSREAQWYADLIKQDTKNLNEET